MMDIEKTRAGLEPSTSTEVPYTITTQIAEEYIQGLFDLAVAARRKNAQSKDIEISLRTIECSKKSKGKSKFNPFLLIMPLAVLENQVVDSGNKNEAAIFSTSDTERKVYIEQDIYTIIKPFLFSGQDIKAFKTSESTKRNLNLTLGATRSLAMLQHPKVKSFGNDRNKSVLVMIDPIRLFHHMLENPGHNKGYFVDVTNSERIMKGSYKYEVYKIYYKNNKKGKGGNSGVEKIRDSVQSLFDGPGRFD